jgi:4'-phosphopantetheinyl transferase EntD
MIKILACAIVVETVIRIEAAATLVAFPPHKNRGSGYDAMALAHDQELGLSLCTLAPPGIIIGHRLITVGDEHALLPEEASAFERSEVQVRRASGAARIVARALLHRLGHEMTALPKSLGGAPIWPKGVLGSLAHDSRVAVAAVGTSENLEGVGIDVEPAEILPADFLHLVTTPRERARIDSDPYRGRLFFAAKEAVYKAVYPLDQALLGHHDVEVDLANQQATVRNGRVVKLRFRISTRLVVLAFLP